MYTDLGVNLFLLILKGSYTQQSSFLDTNFFKGVGSDTNSKTKTQVPDWGHDSSSKAPA
jgi:hypothetical protein